MGTLKWLATHLKVVVTFARKISVNLDVWSNQTISYTHNT